MIEQALVDVADLFDVEFPKTQLPGFRCAAARQPDLKQLESFEQVQDRAIAHRQWRGLGVLPACAELATFEEGKAKQKDVVNKTLAQKANSDDPKVRKIAVDALTQVEPEKKIVISRPEEYNGHYIKVSGLLAVPQIEQYLLDTDSKRFQLKDKSVYWRVAAEYERGLIETAMKLHIDIEG